MESTQKGFEFLDFAGLSEDEIKEIQELLNPANELLVDLPWKISPPEAEVENTEQVLEMGEDNHESSPLETENNEVVHETSEQLAYTSPPYPYMTNVSHPGLMPINPTAFVSPPGVNVPNINQFASPPPYFLPRTAIPYLRGYTQVGVPLISMSSPQDVNAMSQYHLTPVPTAMVKSDADSGNDGRQKLRNHNDKQYMRRGRKKLMVNTPYCTDAAVAVDSYHPGTVIAEPTALPADSNREHLSQSMTHTPLVPFSAFAVAGGALHITPSTPGYHPSITPLSYSHLPGPQAPSTPVFYVPVYNPPYGYIHQPTSGPTVLTTVPAGMPYTANGCGTTLPVEQPVESSSDAQDNAVQTVNQKNASINELDEAVANHEKTLLVTESCNNNANNLEENSVTCVYSENETIEGKCDGPIENVTNDISRIHLTDNEGDGNVPMQENGNSHQSDVSHRSWADLFRNEEIADGINGVDHPSEASSGEVIFCNEDRLAKIKNANSLPHNENELTNSERVND